MVVAEGDTPGDLSGPLPDPSATAGRAWPSRDPRPVLTIRIRREFADPMDAERAPLLDAGRLRLDWAMVESPAPDLRRPAAVPAPGERAPPVAWVCQPVTAEGRPARAVGAMPTASASSGPKGSTRWSRGRRAGVVTLFMPDAGVPDRPGGRVRRHVRHRGRGQDPPIGPCGDMGAGNDFPRRVRRLAARRDLPEVFALDRASRRAARLYGSPPRDRPGERRARPPSRPGRVALGRWTAPRLVAGPALPRRRGSPCPGPPARRVGSPCLLDGGRPRPPASPCLQRPRPGRRSSSSASGARSAWPGSTRTRGGRAVAGSTEAAAFELADGVSPAVGLGLHACPRPRRRPVPPRLTSRHVLDRRRGTVRHSAVVSALAAVVRAATAGPRTRRRSTADPQTVGTVLTSRR